jgi:hypothetical protein
VPGTKRSPASGGSHSNAFSVLSLIVSLFAEKVAGDGFAPDCPHQPVNWIFLLFPCLASAIQPLEVARRPVSHLDVTQERHTTAHPAWRGPRRRTTHLALRGGRWVWRRRLPRRVLRHFGADDSTCGFRDIQIALGTGERRTAGSRRTAGCQVRATGGGADGRGYGGGEGNAGGGTHDVP